MILDAPPHRIGCPPAATLPPDQRPLHLAAALRANVTALATNDPGFDLVLTVTLYKPSDVT